MGDVVLLGLLGLLAGWTALAGGRVLQQLTLLAVVGAAYVAGRLAASAPVLRTLVPALLAVGVAAAVLLAEDGLSGTALAGPVGYGNANGALCTLGAGAALVAGFTRRGRLPRAAGLVAAAGLGYLAHRTGSTAATGVTAVLVVLAATTLVRPRWLRSVPRLGAAALLLTVVFTVALGVLGEGRAGLATDALSERRVVLWSEAIDLTTEEPVSGVGVGGFAKTAPTAVADADARWVHSAWLQQAAETGLAGGVLLVLLALAGVLGAGRARRSAAGALAGATVAAVLVQASIDYVLHFPHISVPVGLLVGVATTTSGRLDRPSG